MTDSVLIDRDKDTAIVTLNRPEKLNAWDTPMRDSIRSILAKLNADAGVRAVVLTGAGERAFCAGQDLEETQKLSSGKAGADWFQSWKAFYGAFRDMDKPLVAALNGVAAGSAFQVAMLCDILVGHRDGRLGQPEINSGIPTVLGAWLMHDRIGLSRTTELILTGRMMDGEECHRIGLFHYLVAKDQVLAKAKEVAAMLAAKPPVAMRLNKRRLREITLAGFEDAIEAGKPIQHEAYQSGEPQRSMAAFFAERAKRKQKG